MKRNLRLMPYLSFFNDFNFYESVAVLYFAQVSGSFALGMGVFSLIRVFSALLEVPTGIFSDRIGRRKTVILGAGSALIASLFYALGGSFLILAVGSFFL